MINISKFLLFTGSCMLLVACQKDIHRQVNLQVPSLKDNLPNLFAEAKKWDKDAYLYSATVPVAGSIYPWKVRTVFYSRSRPYTSIILTLSSSGVMKLDDVDHTTPALQREPIIESDWIIDSHDALAIFVSNDQSVEEFLTSFNKHCSDITLERFTPENTQPVVWSLSLFDCKGKSKYAYLDPIKGDILDLSRSVIPDAILITPSP